MVSGGTSQCHLTACDTFEKRKQIASLRNANIFQRLTSQPEREYSSVSWGEDRETGQQTARLDIIWEIHSKSINIHEGKEGGGGERIEKIALSPAISDL